jgi:hypothetical protein
MTPIEIADIIFVFVSIVGLAKIIPAIRKLQKVEYSDAHSLVHHESHVILLSLMIFAYIIIGAIYGLVMGYIELVSRLYFIKMIRNKRSHILTYPSDIIYYTHKYYIHHKNSINATITILLIVYIFYINTLL